MTMHFPDVCGEDRMLYKNWSRIMQCLITSVNQSPTNFLYNYGEWLDKSAFPFTLTVLFSKPIRAFQWSRRFSICFSTIFHWRFFLFRFSCSYKYNTTDWNASRTA